MKAGLAVLAAAALAGCYDTGPHLDSATPNPAFHNDVVTISGSNLCGDSGACAGAAGTVDLGINPPFVRMPVTSYGDGTITIVIPPVAPVGPTQLTVTVNDTSSNAIAFEVKGDPAGP
ncbi:MAG TPA: IPT/TIG domain-containing protein [Kofleriaceae bacterium]|nr:IPT/TIG domain-containing protein [Kofleriaceae bacterium]